MEIVILKVTCDQARYSGSFPETQNGRQTTEIIISIPWENVNIPCVSASYTRQLSDSLFVGK